MPEERLNGASLGSRLRRPALGQNDLAHQVNWLGGSWLLEGEVVHHDSLLNENVLRPRGGGTVMTSGRVIAHAERAPVHNSGRLSGVQLWTALPDGPRQGAASFQHVPEVPVHEVAGGRVQIFSGTLGDLASPAEHFSALIGADVQAYKRESCTLPLQREHEHAGLVLEGDCAIEDEPLAHSVLYYLGTQRAEMTISSTGGTRVLLVGGVPFPETILMWWNFVARTPDEIRDAREDWEAHRRFGDVQGYKGPRLAAPELPRLAPPNPVS